MYSSTRTSHRTKWTAALVLALMEAVAHAQSFPTKAISMLYPFPPGTAGETLLRALGQEASKTLGRPVIVEFKPGAGGTVAFRTVLNAEPGDGHLLAFVNVAPLIIRPLASSEPRPMPGRDYTPVTFIFEAKQILVANALQPFRDPKGLIAYAKANPGRLNYGSTGVGSISHLSMQLFSSMAGIELTHIPYKGSPEALPPLLSNTIQLLTMSAEAKTYVDRGQLVALGTTSQERMAAFPESAPIADTLPGYSFATWYGFVAPREVPRKIVMQLNEAFNAAMKADLEPVRMASRLGGLDLTIGRSPDEFRQRILSDFALLEPVVKKAGITLSD
jgi:tripartite-type tricarboxylate transporter receptor subunit TctC